jgi:cell division protein FtsB
MLFLDANSIPTQFSITQKLNRLEAEKEYYQERIVEVKQDREELMSNPELLEKFAREKYLMRKPTEDVYVIQYQAED